MVPIVTTDVVALPAAASDRSTMSTSSCHGARVIVLAAVIGADVPRTSPPADQVDVGSRRSGNVNVGVPVDPACPAALTDSDVDSDPVLAKDEPGTWQAG